MDPVAEQQRTATVLSVDAIGYSRLMASDEVGTLRTLIAYREEIGLLVRQHGGRILESPGDSVVAEIGGALEGARCAIAIQQVLLARNADLPEGRRLEFRIGVHHGEALFGGERVYGDGPAIASRLEGLAGPGEICISGPVHDRVRDPLMLDCVDLGEQEVEGIATPVRAFRVRITAGPVVVPETPDRRLARLAVLAATLALVLGGAALAVWGLSGEPSLPDVTGAPR